MGGIIPKNLDIEPFLAERKGFEPSIRCRIHTFQACSFNHSDTSLKEAQDNRLVVFNQTVQSDLSWGVIFNFEPWLTYCQKYQICFAGVFDRLFFTSLNKDNIVLPDRHRSFAG